MDPKFETSIRHWNEYILCKCWKLVEMPMAKIYISEIAVCRN